ncbi:MAG: hypothetical protein K2X91_03740, partial [Thermoleophilia bacterium]|nr:hypothetical protein [Thermoleophilia bacterium]
MKPANPADRPVFRLRRSAPDSAPRPARRCGRVRASAMRIVAAVAAFSLAGAELACSPADATRDATAPAESATPKTRLRVQVERVELARLDAAERVTGTIRAHHRATITAEAQGRVLSRGALPGTPVAAGGLLIELEDARQVLELRRAEAA